MTELLDRFEKILPVVIDEKGFPHPPLLARHHDGKVTMATMAVPGEEIFATVLAQFMTDLTVCEIIFGIDRYTRPEQGTKYADVLTVFWWNGEHTKNYGFRFGIVDYVPPPDTVIEPINWDNPFWNDIMLRIVGDTHHNMALKMERYRITNPEQVALVEKQVMAAAQRARGSYG